MIEQLELFEVKQRCPKWVKGTVERICDGERVHVRNCVLGNVYWFDPRVKSMGSYRKMSLSDFCKTHREIV